MAVLAQNTITLIRVDDGTDGKGVASITRQYYVSTSKIAPTGGSWTTTAPAWSLGKYLWTRYEIKYTNPSSTVYTTAYCDSSWEAINEIQIGGRNLIVDSSFSTGKLDNEVRNYGSSLTFSDDSYILGTKSLFYSYTTGPNDGGQMNKGIQIVLSLEKIDSETVYTLSFYGKGWEALSPISIYSPEFTLNYSKKYVLDNGWTKYVFGFTPKTLSNSNHIFIRPNGNTDYDFSVTFNAPKFEKGNKATDWTPAPEDTAMSIDEIHNQLDGIDNIITNTQTNFEQKIDSITATVEQTQQTVVDYQGQLTQIRTDISTEIEQVASGLNLTIEEIYNQFSDLGDVTETIRTFFKVTSDGLMITQDGNPTSTLMGYDHFAVLLNDTEVVKIYQDSMQAPNGIFDSSVTIGPIKFEGYSEGVALKWVG